ncbi:MAG: TonB-dependent receptor, partial [Alteraurantiacibacter sp. bin_em_oilr2.035]|nr:TonB-dependent receptor [Alteraurantiacibacter sp. bin_em_oilr2.035]
GLPGSTDLMFHNYATVNIRSFIDLGKRDKLVAAAPFFENTRIGFDIDNIFDTRQRVTDSNGDTPLRYQPFLIDPTGRSFEIEFRKLF